ncbi:DNA ligase 1-like isoform X2 [Xenia sp. Carnegie-2017]|uniref:DNA ligase 1-like isoform X2 n=1 Tax=Xenia sp. Carnegie-2017 TaxID=2897299 RepID=UPI001F03CA05|nr:DNA ligase 1-like isoform X2 [Xenia sp. Carnegie-2017]
MPQRSISSFFTSKPKVTDESNDTENRKAIHKGSNVDTSPVKKTKKKNRNKVLSDSDNEECDESGNCQETNGKKGELVQNSSLEDDNGEVGSVKEASSSSGEKKPPKRKTARKHMRKRKADENSSSNSSESHEEIQTKKLKVCDDDVMKCEPKEECENRKESTLSESENETMSGSKPNGNTTSKTTEQGPKEDEKNETLTDDEEIVDPVVYNPEKNCYHPLKHACWKHKERVPYLALARTFQCIESTSARLKITSTLSNLFRSVIALTPQDLLPCLYLCLNKLAPSYEGIELGIGDGLLIKVIAETTGRSTQQVKLEFGEKGDLGIVAEASRSTQRTMFTPAKLTVSTVYNKLKEIALMTGHSSVNRKADKVKSMFVACRQSEARYLTRSLAGKLRIGLAEQTVLTALAHAVVLTPPSNDFPPETLDASKGIPAEAFKKKLDAAALIVKTCYCELPNYDVLVAALLEHGLKELSKHCHITPGVPLKPMLAHPTKGVEEVFKRFEDASFTCEYKYDGERAQIHVLNRNDIRIYSRNQENNTSKYPDVVARMAKVLKEDVTSCIIDSEAVAWDQEKKQILPFQVLSTRKKKDAEASEIKVQVCIYAFDLLYLNGKSYVKEPFKVRRDILRSSLNEIDGEFIFAKCITSTDTDDIAEFLDESIKGNCEGLMVKTLEVDATYEIAKRSHNWLKLKKDYLEGVGDTLDLLVIGGYMGKGKRAGRYGGFLVACYDEDKEEYQSCCKVSTGMKDEDLDRQYTILQEYIIGQPKPYYRFDSSIEPDVWFDAVKVWEIKCADLSISPVHKAAAGIVDAEKGISLRFPRFIRERDDKKPEQVTSSVQIADMYRNQDTVKNNREASDKTNKDDYDDFY